MTDDLVATFVLDNVEYDRSVKTEGAEKFEEFDLSSVLSFTSVCEMPLKRNAFVEAFMMQFIGRKRRVSASSEGGLKRGQLQV